MQSDNGCYILKTVSQISNINRKIMNNKRNSLKKIAGISAISSVLPSAWMKPVVNSIVLPAHAQMSSMDRIIFTFYVGCGDPTNYTITPRVYITPEISGAVVDYDITIMDNNGVIIADSGPVSATTGNNGFAEFGLVYTFERAKAGPFTYSTTVRFPDGTTESAGRQVEPPYLGTDACAI